MAEGAGFEPAVGYPTFDFESSALNRTQPPFRFISMTQGFRGFYEIPRINETKSNMSEFSLVASEKVDGFYFKKRVSPIGAKRPTLDRGERWSRVDSLMGMKPALPVAYETMALPLCLK